MIKSTVHTVRLPSTNATSQYPCTRVEAREIARLAMVVPSPKNFEGTQDRGRSVNTDGIMLHAGSQASTCDRARAPGMIPPPSLLFVSIVHIPNGSRNNPYYLIALLLIAYVPLPGSQCNSLARVGTLLRLVQVLYYVAMAGKVDRRGLIRRVAQSPILRTTIRGGTG